MVICSLHSPNPSRVKNWRLRLYLKRTIYRKISSAFRTLESALGRCLDPFFIQKSPENKTVLYLFISCSWRCAMIRFCSVSVGMLWQRSIRTIPVLFYSSILQQGFSWRQYLCLIVFLHSIRFKITVSQSAKIKFSEWRCFYLIQVRNCLNFLEWYRLMPISLSIQALTWTPSTNVKPIYFGSQIS